MHPFDRESQLHGGRCCSRPPTAHQRHQLLFWHHILAAGAEQLHYGEVTRDTFM